MSLYIGEKEIFLDECLQSLSDQTMPATEIVMVLDGPISLSLESVIDKWQEVLPLKLIRLDSNVGLGRALNAGLAKCSFDIVFRMDTDDVCSPYRFEKQMLFFSKNPTVSILGTNTYEFDHSIEISHAMRCVPSKHVDIVKYAKKRCPFNHMTVAFKKESVLNAGGYQSNFLYEDYALWVRMICQGAEVANLNEPLVHARVGNGMERRRGGWQYALSEYRSQLDFYRLGFLNRTELLMNLMLRLPVRLLPGEVRKFVYRKFLRR
ncbi:glycosyltransferase [Gallaecimonas kandeliae]|uniref:glycosyltransferase n=1 Tax=Gallaecimonas kandeliae TaxID=3029055 RepID=UPI00264A01F3|nr:glycosyltransferase [Gallaecimonas kandeliae]WKE66792.1 glycosyltransferase [Gallaecimonas kandeliae]